MCSGVLECCRKSSGLKQKLSFFGWRFQRKQPRQRQNSSPPWLSMAHCLRLIVICPLTTNESFPSNKSLRAQSLILSPFYALSWLRRSCNRTLLSFCWWHSAGSANSFLMNPTRNDGEWKWCIIGLQNPLTDQLNSCSVWFRQLVNDPCLTLTLSSPLCKNHIYSKKFSGHHRSISVISCQVKKHINTRLYQEYGATHTHTPTHTHTWALAHITAFVKSLFSLVFATLFIFIHDLCSLWST